MRHHRLVIVCFALSICLAPIADAQLSDTYADWADGPEGFLLTKKEKKAWKKIASDAEAERFIELFWARRNPEPTSPYNAFRADFEAKVQFAGLGVKWVAVYAEDWRAAQKALNKMYGAKNVKTKPVTA